MSPCLLRELYCITRAFFPYQVRRPAPVDDQLFTLEEDATLFHAAPNFANVPYGTRLGQRRPYNIIDSEDRAKASSAEEEE